MTIIKSYTDISQSKKLAEILPHESADMVLLHEEPYETSDSKFDGLHQVLCVPFNKYGKSWRQKYKNISYFPCWSLAALRNLLPTAIKLNKDLYLFESHNTFDNSWVYRYYDENDTSYLYCKNTNEVDACYEMIIKLHELKML